VAALQRAFTKSRLILRTMNVRERIDPTRRLTGDAKGEGAWRRPPSGPEITPSIAALRRVLDQLTSLSSRSTFNSGDRSRLASAAESVVQADPASAAVRETASRLTTAADAVATGQDPTRVKDLVTAASVELSTMLRAALRADAERPLDPAAATLGGAL